MNIQPQGRDPIRHVVLLMLENHSFDQMLGCFKELYPHLEGVDPTQPKVNVDNANRHYPQQSSRQTHVDPDPQHDLGNVLRQLESDSSGFVFDYSLEYPTTTAAQRSQIMDYFPRNFLYAL